MRPMIALWLVLAAGLAAPVPARAGETRSFGPGTPVVVVGAISSPPRGLGKVRERKLQVAVGAERTDYTLHLEGAALLNTAGKKLRLADLRAGGWVRAEGTAVEDLRRVRVDRLTLLGKGADAYPNSASWRPDAPEGYVTDQAEPAPPSDAASPFPPGAEVQILGWISRRPRYLGLVRENTAQVAVGTERADYTLDLDQTRILDNDSRDLPISDLRDPWWVSAEGIVREDGRRIEVSRLRVLGRNRHAYQRSALWRADAPYGYAVTVAAGAPAVGGAPAPGAGGSRATPEAGGRTPSGTAPERRQPGGP